MINGRLPLLQKLIVSFFVLIFLASLVFIGYRIFTKPAYEAYEKEQAKILALSVIELFAEKTSEYPEIWTKFDTKETELVIDHKKVTDNWVIKISFSKRGSFVQITSSVKSGWNSRSPQSALFKAKIYPDGKTEYEDNIPAATLGMIKKTDNRANGRTYLFRFPDEMKKVPVDIKAEERLISDSGGKEFLIIKNSSHQ
ncbi:MAG: hypothetical protein PHO18_07565 [Synergistaceae bacterium]|nr:hypothetical protein [Synergistaceae bacterium]